MTDDEAAFLSAIKAEPDCDTHRLVYADWLQEQGREDRAQLIRTQIRHDHAVLPRLSAPWATTTRQQRAEKSVIVQHGRSLKCAEQLRRDVSVELLGQHYRAGVLWWERGFLGLVSCSWKLWAAIGDDLTAREWVPYVILGQTPGVLTQTCPSLGAPAPWCVGYSLRKTLWSWETLGKPAINPHDEDALAKCICEAEWPGTQFSFVRHAPLVNT